jgi:hypothetical protein
MDVLKNCIAPALSSSVHGKEREKNIWESKKEGIARGHFWVGIRHLQGIERGMPRTARQSGGLQQTKHDGDKKATCKKSYQSMRRRDFNIISLTQKGL